VLECILDRITGRSPNACRHGPAVLLPPCRAEARPRPLKVPFGYTLYTVSVSQRGTGPLVAKQDSIYLCLLRHRWPAVNNQALANLNDQIAQTCLLDPRRIPAAHFIYEPGLLKYQCSFYPPGTHDRQQHVRQGYVRWHVTDLGGDTIFPAGPHGA